MAEIIGRNCKHCDTPFETRYETKIYCSTHCGKLTWRKMWRERNRKEIAAYNKVMRKTKAVRKLLANDPCVLCRKQEDLHLHHIIPIKHGGDNSPSNVMMLCNLCHADWHNNVQKYLLPLIRFAL